MQLVPALYFKLMYFFLFFFFFYRHFPVHATTLVGQRFSHGSIDPRFVTRAKKNAISGNRLVKPALRNIQKKQSVPRCL